MELETNMLILQQIILGLIFLILTGLSFYFTGFLTLGSVKNKLDNLEKFTLATVLGMVIFTLSAYVLAFLNLRFLMYLFPLGGLFGLFWYRSKIFSTRFNFKHKYFFLIVFILGIIGQVAVNAPSGLPYKEGIYFWSSHGHDGVWHLALMEQMHKNQFPFQNPELDGAKLQNYHFFADLLMSEFSRLFPFSNLDIYFRFMPILLSVLMGLTVFIFVRLWSNKELAGIWAMIFTYFCGSFGYLLYIPTHKSLGGESIFWVSQTQSVLGNPPHASAFIILTAFLFVFLKFLKDRNIVYFLLAAILGGSVIEFKVYAGVLILGGLFVMGLSDVLIQKSFQVILLFIATLAITLVIYLPNSANSQDFLIFQPWWFIRTMVVAPDRLNWIDLELRRQTYVAESNWKRVAQLEITAFLIFLFGNLGMRFLGFWVILKQLKDNIFKDSFNLFFLSMTVASFFIPVFFLQKGVAWNSIQFNQYFLLLFGLLAGIASADLLSFSKAKLIKLVFAGTILILAIPTQLGLLWQFYSNPALSKVSSNELEALNFLKKQPDGIVLTAPFNKYEKEKYKNPPIPIYVWYDTGYVSAFSQKETLISDEEQVDIMGYDVGKLVQERLEAFESADFHKMNSFLQKYKVDFIYLAWDQKIATDSSLINAKVIFDNKDATIFKVEK